LDNGDSSGEVYTVDLGYPIITLNNDDFDDAELLNHKKSLLRQAISIQSVSLMFFRQELGYLNWIVNNITNKESQQPPS